MWSSWIQNRFADLSTLLCILLVTASVSLIPLTPQGQVARVEAGGVGTGVFVLGGNGSVQQSLTAASTAISATAQTLFNMKKLTIDPLAQTLARMIVQSMTQSIVRWINGGFNGSPAFISDMKQYLLQQADIAAGNYIYNDPSLSFLCSPFKIDVTVALATSYYNETQNGMNTQCTLTDVSNNISNFLNGDFGSGGWASWFQISLNPQNTPTGAYLASKVELDNRVAQAQNQLNQEANWGNGFLSYKTCVNVTANGKTTPHCTIATPGKVIVSQLDKALGAGQDTLVSANEVNQVVSALFAQLAYHAVSGVTGLLGLSSSGGSSNVAGVSGGQSYLNALAAAQPPAGASVQDPIPSAITETRTNIGYQNQIIGALDAEQHKYQSFVASMASCSSQIMPYPTAFTSWRTKAVTDRATASSSLVTLRTMEAQYASSTDPQQQITIMSNYAQRVNNGSIVTHVTNTQTKSFIDNYIFAAAPLQQGATNPYNLAGFDQAMQTKQQSCHSGNNTGGSNH